MKEIKTVNALNDKNNLAPLTEEEKRILAISIAQGGWACKKHQYRHGKVRAKPCGCRFKYAKG